MNKNDFIRYLTERIETDRHALQQMEGGSLKTLTKGEDDTQQSIETLQKDIPQMEELLSWIASL